MGRVIFWNGYLTLEAENVNTKKLLVTSFLCLLSFSLAFGVHSVKADSSSPMTFAGDITLISPVNETYTSNSLTLDLNLTCGGLPYVLTYTIDGTNEGTIPLTFSQSLSFLFEVETGTVQMPTLSNGSHKLTIDEEAYLNNYHGANPPGAPFKQTSPGSDNYTCSWTDTVNFSINGTVAQTTPAPTPTSTPSPTPTPTPTATVPELSWLVIVPLLLSVFSVAVIIRQRKTSN